MAVAGGRLVGIHWMHDTREEASGTAYPYPYPYHYPYH